MTAFAGIDQLSRQDEPGERVELYELDLSIHGGMPIYFHPYTAKLTGYLVFQGKTYQPFPIMSEGWETDTRGTQAHPTLTVANIDSIVTSLMRQYADFIGCKITRRQTYVEYLDENPYTGIANTDPLDQLQEYPPNIYFVNRKIAETNSTVQFELAAQNDVKNIELPFRQVTGTYCHWDYRGDDCTYNDVPVADVDNKAFTKEDGVTPLVPTTDRNLYNSATIYGEGDYTYVLIGPVGQQVRVYYVSRAGSNTKPLTDKAKWVRDTCSKTIHGCRRRFSPAGLPEGFGAGVLPFGDFPGANKIPTY